VEAEQELASAKRMRRHAQVELWRVTTAQEGERVGLDRDSKGSSVVYKIMFILLSEN
jgi:cation transport regulator ChaC